MISYIRGPLREVLDDTVVLEAGGIGYNIFVPLSVLDRLPSIGTEVILYTFFQVREDAMCLYGFLQRSDLKMFKQLIGVNGIGPKGALGILSALEPDQLRMAIISGDAKSISKAPGIGAKTAQRVILDLKDKISNEDLLSDGGQSFATEAAGATGMAGAAKEAVEALTALGYSGMDAAGAVRKVSITEEMTTEEVLRASLKYLAF